MGGGMFFYSSPNVNLSANRVLGNAANPTLGSGGGVWVDSGSSFVMVNNVVAGNRAGGYGGGLGAGANETEPVAGILLHNTFVANNAGSANGQVGIYLASAWINLELVNNLFSTHSYGLCAAGGTATLNRTLFYANSSGDICPGGSVVNTDPFSGYDPRLDATYHLRAGSAAIDWGIEAGVTEDIDGDARPIGAGYDIGADEYTEPHRVFLPVALKAR